MHQSIINNTNNCQSGIYHFTKQVLNHLCSINAVMWLDIKAIHTRDLEHEQDLFVASSLLYGASVTRHQRQISVEKYAGISLRPVSYQHGERARTLTGIETASKRTKPPSTHDSCTSRRQWMAGSASVRVPAYQVGEFVRRPSDQSFQICW